MREEIKKEKNHMSGGKWIGAILVLVGGVSLWNLFMPFPIRSEVLWPMILVALGTWFLTK